MTDHQRKKIVEIISSEINSKGFVRMNSLTPLLEQQGGQFGISRSIYGDQGPKRWIESNFPEFRIDGNYGKETIVFSTSSRTTIEHTSTPSNFTIEEETVSWDMLAAAAEIEPNETAYKIGVINYCTFKNAFINQWHGKGESTTEALSVIFNPTTVRTYPENIQFNTKEFVYLVCYAVSGTVKNTKTGLDHPALDYSMPIRVIRTLPKKQCIYIRILPEKVILGHKVETRHPQEEPTITLEQAVNAIDAFLRNELSENDYVLSAYFPNIAKKCGLPNFRNYADTVELFLEKYLSEYELKKNISIQGKVYPGIIMLKGKIPVTIEDADLSDADFSDSSTETDIICDDSLVMLDELFENGRYVDYLSSDILKKIQPHELPIEYLEKALTCAHRLIYPGSLESISLNTFQRELVANPTTAMFIKKWKNHGSFAEEIIVQCGDTAIAHFDYPEHNALVVKLLNAIGAEKTLNNNYVGLTARFVACENVLIPHFYIIRAFVLNAKASIQKIVSEYCQIVKDMRHSTSGPRMSDDLRLCSFGDVIRIIHTHIFECSQIAQNIRTNIVSVFVEYDKMRTLQEIIPLWDAEKISPEWQLVDLYFNSGKWNEEKFAQLINAGVNRQLLQRCLALLWRESSHNNVLEEKYLNFLSWVILHDDHTSVEEIIRYTSGKDLTRIDKQSMLINSFEAVCDYAVSSDNMYVLASYIAITIRTFISSNNASADISDKLEFWNKFSNDYYINKTQEFHCITPETESQFTSLFKAFQLDLPNYLKLQEQYSKWFVQSFSSENLSDDNIDATFDELYSKGAYAAFVDCYSLDSQFEMERISSKHVSQYIEALIYLRRYSDAISFLWEKQGLPVSEKNALLIRAIGENFRENGISPKGFSCISDASMRNGIFDILMAEFKPTQPLIINSLIALYTYEKKYLHAAYLFTIFSSRMDKGFVRLYGQIRGQLGKYTDFNKIKSPHHVIAYAFQTLKSDDLIDFLSWTARIAVPNYKDHKEGHVFGFYYDKIMANPIDQDVWISFLNHLLKNGLERNAWNICVCETVLRKELHYRETNYSQSALDYLLTNTSTALYPSNFLPYAFYIIEDSQSASLCRRLVDMLTNKTLYQHMISDNVWLNAYDNSIKAFKQYCQNAYGSTGNSAFHEILSLLGTELSISELKEFAQSATSKQALFSRICYNYLNDCHVHETIEVLFSEDWGGMTENEYALLNILRIIYTDDEVLLLDAESLFDGEYSVWRFKRDCAEIISTYPEKTGLFAFDKACNNEAYKTLVYSYVFDVLYDQDIYESLDKRYSDFTNTQTYKVYLRLLESAYKAQSIQNSTFPFFYQKWRYLKLYLARILRYPVRVDDVDIISLMERNGIHDEVYTDSYVPFVETVTQFIGLKDLSQEFKNHFLFSVMVSHAEDLYASHAQTLCRMPAEDKLICRKLVAFLDYRYFNASLIEFLWKDIKTGDFSVALPLAESISDFAYDALVALKDNFNSATISMFEQLSFMDKGSRILKAVVAMDASEIEEHHHWIVPLLCSRQFDFWISNRFRAMVITQRDNLVCEKYKYISEYLLNKGKSHGIYTHLRALLACINSNSELARHIIGNGEFCSQIPLTWLDEAKRIIEYANGSIQKFKTDKVNLDGSRENIDENIEFSFPKNILAEVFGEDNIPTSVQHADESYAEYLRETDPWLQSKLGLEILSWRSNPQNSKIRSNIPSVNDLVLDTGLGLLRPEVGLTLEDRLTIATELYSNRLVFSGKKYSSQVENLKSKLAAMINTGFSLVLWIKHGTIIEEFLREANALMDFAELRKRILDKCAEVSSPNIGNDEKYKRYISLLNAFSGLTSSYSMSVMRALKDEIERLANGIRLSIKIENEKLETTDNCVYFRVSNIGNRTVSFSTEALAMVLQQKDQPDVCVNIEHIAELHSGSTTGGRVQLIVFSEKRIPVKLMITHTTPSGYTEIVCSTEEELSITDPSSPSVPAEALTAARESVSFAVIDDKLLFGRDDKKELLAKSIPSGITLIYGPSRIGKTSLMNWIRKRHAIDRGNVLSVLIGGENGLGKDSDYEQKVTDPTKAVPYDDPYQMSQYLLVDTLIYGLTKRNRRGDPGRVKLPNNLTSDMLRILKDEVTSIDSKYFEINELLKTSGVELWLLIDEFQQVVEHWKNIPNWCEFVEICNLLSSPEVDSKPNNIKIIFCGSDDLLTHMVLKRDSVWKKVFRSTVSVNALRPEDFETMIKRDKAISMTNLVFSDSAISTLFAYTGGIALYGKEICRAIFEDVAENSQKWAFRSTIYTSDIAEATQRLLNRQNHELSIRAQEGISTIYAAVTKNLNEHTDMQLLWYMAKWLYQNPQQDGFPISNFTKETLTPRFEEHLHDSLSIAEARGIIKKTTSHYNGETVYVFNTLFYYFAFCGSATKDNLDESLIFASEDSIAEMDDVSPSDPLSALNDSFEQIPQDKREKAFHMLYGGLSPEQKKNFRIGFGDYSETNIGTQNNVQVNVQSITNTLNGIFAASGDPSKMLEGIQSLPRLDAYLPQLNSSDSQDISEARLSRAIDGYVADLEEGWEAAQEESEKLGIAPEKTPNWIIMGFNCEDDYDDFMQQYDLPAYFLNSLQFAHQLDQLFMKGSVGEASITIDYSPVTIMYCKLIESMLKEYHIELYSRCLGNLKTDIKRADDKTLKYTWREIRDLPSEQKQQLTIGSFTFPLNMEWVVPKLARFSKQDVSLWELHKEMITVVRDIRNPSAHGNKGHRISLEQKNDIIRLLFDEHGFVRLIELVSDSIQ